MNQPNAQSHLDALSRSLDEDLAADFPEAKLGHRPGVAAPRPVVPKAGAGAGAWGPTTTTPPVDAQLACILEDAQRLVETLEGLREALAVIRKKLG